MIQKSSDLHDSIKIWKPRTEGGRELGGSMKNMPVWLRWATWPLGFLFSYLAAISITGDRAANLDLCLAVIAFSSKGSFFVPRPTATRDFGLNGRIRRTGIYVPQWNSNRERKDHQIFEPPL
jgi:hypothetical protein